VITKEEMRQLLWTSAARQGCQIIYLLLFVLTLQTDFTARCCFYFSANDSSLEQFAQP